MENGAPTCLLVLYGALAFPFGLYLWHRQGPHFGLGDPNGKVGIRAALISAGLFLIVTRAGSKPETLSDPNRSSLNPSLLLRCHMAPWTAGLAGELAEKVHERQRIRTDFAGASVAGQEYMREVFIGEPVW
jgi:hypothetical protein